MNVPSYNTVQKCSGERPTCSYCHRRNLECQYDVRIGSSRRAELEQKLNEATSRSWELGIILHALRTGTDEESTMLLARLRMGESLDGVLNTLLSPETTVTPSLQDQPEIESKLERQV